MDMTGEYRIPAPREAVWRALNDPDILKRCIPGCETVEKISDTEFQARVTAAVGPVKAKFGGKVTLSDIDPPNGYTISGEGQGGAAGFAKGGAKVKLAPDADGTLLSYQVTATVGGKLAQVGSRLIDGVSKKMAGEFFSRFADLVGQHQPQPAAPAGTPTAAAAPVSSAPSAGAAAGGLPGWAWILGVIVLAGILLAIFGRG
ncbi:MAG: carbon monoxide dehydrogenase subunit G [Alphaproteobacteria bacterium]|nr:carbon monoxide dehydrogenase subunit G [Alphaproteobacteria bacterium]